MNNLLKSWKTTLIGLVIIVALFWNGIDLSVESAIALLIAIGFITSKDATASHTKGSPELSAKHVGNRPHDRDDDEGE